MTAGRGFRAKTPIPRRHRYVLREPDGTRHELRLRDNDAEEYNQNNWELPGRFTQVAVFCDQLPRSREGLEGRIEVALGAL